MSEHFPVNPNQVSQWKSEMIADASATLIQIYF
jgi:hypothetical protein